jgi:hypothetical protein
LEKNPVGVEVVNSWLLGDGLYGSAIHDQNLQIASTNQIAPLKYFRGPLFTAMIGAFWFMKSTRSGVYYCNGNDWADLEYIL